MKRTAATAALAAAVALPVGPAAACPPSYGSLEAPRRAVAGAEIRVTGTAHVKWCPDTAPSPTPAPATTPSGDPTIGVPLPLRPVAYVTPVRADVEVTLARPDGSGRRRIAVVKADPAEPKASEHAFAATVRLPADVAAGTYEIEAKQRDGVWYGTREITISDGLAATGGHAADLVRLALLSLVAGVAALGAARRLVRQ